MNQEFLFLYHHILTEPSSQTKRGTLSLEEYAAIEAFVAYSYDLSAYLRDDRQPQVAMYDEAIQALLGLWTKLPQYTSPLYRGTRLPNIVFEEMLDKGIYCDKSFLSTTDSEANAMRHMNMDAHENPEDEYTMVLLTIVSQNNGLDISHHSSIAEIDGREALFPPNTTFQVINHQISALEYNDGSSRVMHRIQLVEI